MLVGYRIEFDATHGMARILYEKDLTDSSLLEGFLSFAAFAEDRPLDGFIVDFSEVVEPSISAAGLRSISSRPPVAPGKPRALVAPQDVMYGMCRMFQIHRDGTDSNPVTVVRTLAEALEFLGVESYCFTPVGTDENSRPATV